MDFVKAYRINMISYKSCTVNCTEGLPLKEYIHLEIFSNGPACCKTLYKIEFRGNYD